MKYWLTPWVLSPSLAIGIIAYIDGLAHDCGNSSVLPMEQGWQVLDGLGKNRLKPPVKTVRKKQVLDNQNGQNWSKL